jgi:hypothetical protein
VDIKVKNLLDSDGSGLGSVAGFCDLGYQLLRSIRLRNLSTLSAVRENCTVDLVVCHRVIKC